ncbi:MAG TPA: F0F1 ATP synthase subunit epsilon [Nitrospiria bacterium]
MAKTIQFDLVTPEKRLISETVDEVIAPGAGGDFGVLPGHTPFLSTLRIGELQYRMGERWKSFSVSWGYAEVGPDRITVLAELAEAAGEIDVARAEEAAKRAEKEIAAAEDKSAEMKAARDNLEKALLRIRVGKKG